MITFFISLLLSLRTTWGDGALTKTKLILGHTELLVEVADTDELREKGLMGRKSLKDDEGMLFIFDQEGPQGFWMKNTLIPLSIGFFDERGQLFQVLEMDPASPMDLSPKVYHSQKPAKFALEEPQGWFKRKKINANQVWLKLPQLHLP